MDNTDWKITDNNIDKITLNYKKKQCIRKRQQGLNILRIISPIILSFCFSCVLLLDITEYKNTYLINFIAPIHNSVCSLFNCSPKIGYLILAILSLCIEILFSITLKRIANREPDISIDNDKTLIEKAQYLYNFAKNEKSDDGVGWIFWILFLMLLQLVGIIYVGVSIIPFSEFKSKALGIIFLYALTGFILFFYYGLHFPDDFVSYEFCKKCEDYLKEKRAEEDARIEAVEKAKKLKRACEIFSVATSSEQIDYKKLEEAAHLGHMGAATILAKKAYSEIDKTLKTERENLSIYKKVINILENVDNKDGDALYIWLVCMAPVKGFNLKGWNYFLDTMRRFKTDHSISQEYYDNLDYAISIAIEQINKMDNNGDDFDDEYDDNDGIFYKDLQVYKDAYNESISSNSCGCSHRWNDGTCHQVSTSWYCSSCPYKGRENECYYSS